MSPLCGGQLFGEELGDEADARDLQPALRADEVERLGRAATTAELLESLGTPGPLGEWLARHGTPLSGVFLTHLHLDHVTGLPDVPRHVPVHTGPGETAARGFQNLFTRGTLNRAMEGMGPVQEWQFGASADGALRPGDAPLFDGVVDVFGDGTLWAIWVPGHTGGSTAYLARTEDGPVLFVADACHTRWGWDNAGEPGTFSADKVRSAESLGRLLVLVERHPQIQVRLGHPH